MTIVYLAGGFAIGAIVALAVVAYWMRGWSVR